MPGLRCRILCEPKLPLMRMRAGFGRAEDGFLPIVAAILSDCG
jgi:hypothetical protein